MPLFLLKMREEPFLPADLVMNAGIYRVVQVLSVTVMLAAEILLSFILVWLIEGHGVIACGKGVFDDPNWFLAVVLFTGIPLSVIGASITLFLWCSSKRLGKSL